MRLVTTSDRMHASYYSGRTPRHNKLIVQNKTTFKMDGSSDQHQLNQGV